MDRLRLLRLSLILAPIVAVRAVLFRDFPILLTADSWDFVAATGRIAGHWDFKGEADLGLRDCRTPGYPAFLALFLPLTQMRSDRIVLLQTALGLAGALFGWGIGRALRSPWATAGLMLFLGLNPVYLLYEHVLMSETLSLVLLIALTWVSLGALRDGLGPRRGAVIGALLGCNALVRINSLPFCACLTAGVFLARFRGGPPRECRRSAVRFALACGLIACLVVGPWLGRNYGLYRRVSLNLFQNRALLIYSTMHRGFDPDLPGLRESERRLDRGRVGYDWLRDLTERHGTVRSEDLAGQILREQWASHPGPRLRDMAVAFCCFGGYYEVTGNDRAPILWWFQGLVGRNQAVVRQYTQSEPLARRLGLRFATARGNSIWTRRWRSAGLAFLVCTRPLLSLAFLASLPVAWRRRRPGTAPNFRRPAIACLAAGYLATAAFHAATLTDSDRFSSLYDWVAVLVVLLVAEGLARPRPDNQAVPPDRSLAGLGSA